MPASVCVCVRGVDHIIICLKLSACASGARPLLGGFEFRAAFKSLCVRIASRSSKCRSTTRKYVYVYLVYTPVVFNIKYILMEVKNAARFIIYIS